MKERDSSSLGLFSKIKEKWNNWYYHDLDDDQDESYDDWEAAQMKVPSEPEKEEQFFRDSDQRTVYVLECLGQMTEANTRMEQCADEYEAVTALLIDMEEIENLPKDIRGMIVEQAQKVQMLEEERRKLYPKTGQLSESMVRRLERLEGEIPDGIKKMKEAEDYRKLIKQDLRKLAADKKSCMYQKHELASALVNTRGIALICAVTMILCIVSLVILQFAYQMDVRVGYMIAGGAGAIALTFLYLRHMDAGVESKKTQKKLNKLTALQNTVKIRYVNNTNLLSYLYMKFGVEDSSELEELWGIYVEETGARQKDEKIREDLEYYYEKLTQTLRQYRIKDPEIWTHQCQALIDPREMVEVRHALIARRQKLREQMEYNKKVAENSKQQIEHVRRKFPQYEKEIEQLLKQYQPK